MSFSIHAEDIHPRRQMFNPGFEKILPGLAPVAGYQTTAHITDDDGLIQA
jgi:hypothetical protein